MKKQRLFNLLKVNGPTEMAQLLNWSRQRVHGWADELPDGIVEGIIGRLLILGKDDLCMEVFREMRRGKPKSAKA